MLVVIVVVVAAVIVATKNSDSSSSASPTAVPTTAPGSPVPTALASVVLPTAAEKAAAQQACAPFLKAGNQPKGNKQWGAPPQLVIDKTKHYSATIYTDDGKITASLLADKAPITSNNFLFLSCNGFYDNIIFHRAVKNFMIQGGDPTGTGTGGPGYSFQDELGVTSYTVGTLAMANSGANTNGSQFFIVQGAQGTTLPANYSIFGQVTAGQNVVDAIATAPVHASSSGEPSVCGKAGTESRDYRSGVLAYDTGRGANRDTTYERQGKRRC